MLTSPFSPWRSVLTPQTALDLAHGHLENARKAKSPELALTFCKDAETVLARIKTSVRKTYVSSSRTEDRALCNEIEQSSASCWTSWGVVPREEPATRMKKNGGK